MKLRTFLAPVFVAIAFTACQSGPDTGWDGGSKITPERVEKVSRLAAYTTVKISLSKDPSSKVLLTKISTALNELVSEQMWDVSTMITVANANGLSELVSDEARIALETAPLFVDLFYNQQADLRSVEYAEAFIVGTADGFKMGLGVARAVGAPAGSVDAELDRLIREARATR